MDEVRAKVIDLDLNEILPNRFQPRIKFSEDAIIELSESIKEHGVIQPVVVRPIGDKYEIIAGERRYKASVLAGKDTIPAIITNLNDKDSAEVALIENVQRRDLSSIEEAISYKKILDMGYLTQEQLAIKLGKSQSAVANKVRLLNLCDEVQEALMEDKISERHARSLLKLSTTEKQKIMLEKIINERLTVRKADEEIDKMNSYITDAIEEPTTNVNEGAFSPFNPGFVDVEKIETQAQEINKEKEAVDFTSLLSSTPVVTPPVSLPNMPRMDLGVDMVDPFTPEVYSPNPVPAIDPIIVPENKSELISEIPTTPIVEEIPNFEMPTTFSPNMELFDNIVTPVQTQAIEPVSLVQVEEPYKIEPESLSMADLLASHDVLPNEPVKPVEIVQPEVIEIPPVIEPVIPVPTEEQLNNALEIASASPLMADLLAPQGVLANEPKPVEIVQPEVIEIPPVIEPVIPVPTEEQLDNALEMPTTSPLIMEPIQVMPTTPIVDTPLPSRFLNEKPEESNEPEVDEIKVEQPEEAAKIDLATGNEITSQPAEVRPIIITDYSKQYDPILPNAPKQIEKIDFKQIINLIRDVNSTIEKCGYSIETEEFDLEDIYQVIFKINKN